MTPKPISVVFAVVLYFASPTILAHSGGTDSSGCHTESATGQRHCHNSKGNSEDDNTWVNIGIGLLVVAGLYYTYRWLKSDTQSFSYLEDEKEFPPLNIQFTRDSDGGVATKAIWKLEF